MPYKYYLADASKSNYSNYEPIYRNEVRKEKIKKILDGNKYSRQKEEPKG